MHQFFALMPTKLFVCFFSPTINFWPGADLSPHIIDHLCLNLNNKKKEHRELKTKDKKLGEPIKVRWQHFKYLFKWNSLFKAIFHWPQKPKNVCCPCGWRCGWGWSGWAKGLKGCWPKKDECPGSTLTFAYVLCGWVGALYVIWGYMATHFVLK